MVQETFKELGAENIPVIEVFNKADKIAPYQQKILAQNHPGATFISALNGAGIDELLKKIETMLKF
ncbi:MAG: hypothetical protein NTW04_03240 [Elusimicrobia bacterium]|nr:hypothetical protein [Elusimicrobiota bacterium]